MKSYFVKSYRFLLVENVLNFFFWSTLLFFIYHFLVEYLTLSFLLNSSFYELKGWYPNFYFLIFLILKFIVVLKYILIGVNMFVVLNTRQVDIVIKVFLVVTLLFISSYLPSLIWIFPVQCMLVWSYYQDKSPDIITNNTKGDKWLVFGLILVAFSIRLIWIFYTDNSGNGDAGMRLLGIKKWIMAFENIGFNNDINKVYFFMPSQDWLPLHYYLVGLVGKITNEWFYSPRILSAVIGTLTIIPLFKLCHLKFNKTTAYISVIIFSLYGYHIFLSSLVLSEVFYIYFVIWAYYMIEKWFVSNSDIQLIALAIILGCLCLLRYEGWFISALTIFILPFIKTVKSWRTYFVFSSIVLLFTTFIMVCEMAYGLHPLKAILYSDYEVRIALAKNSNSFVQILRIFKIAFIPFSLISFIVVGVTLMNRKDIKLMVLWFLYLAPLLPFMYKLATGTLTSQARYITLYMVPLLPFVAFMFSKLIKSIDKWKFIIILSIFLLFLNFPFYQKAKNQGIYLRYPSGFHESAAFVKRMDYGRFYLGSGFNWGGFNWQVEADVSLFISKMQFEQNLANRSLKKKRFVSIISSVESDRDERQRWEDQHFDTLVSNGSITHILLFPNGDLSKKLKFSKSAEIYLGINFCKLFEKNGYFIYEIKANIKNDIKPLYLNI